MQRSQRSLKMTKKIYVELDSMYDTRLSLVLFLDETYVNHLDEYDNRVKDNFNSISYDIFNQLYKLRDKSLLASSFLNRIPELIKLTSMDSKLEDTDKIIIILNVYPYSLEEKELNEILEELDDRLVYDSLEVVNINNDDLTPLFLHNNDVMSVFKYDALNWIEKKVANRELIITPLFDTRFVIPSILNNYKKEDTIVRNDFTEVAKGIYNFVLPDIINVKYYNVER